jgi:ACS family hexuronate transporter-like MFS transporter
LANNKHLKQSKYRYRILALLFVATTINYMDRSIIGVLGPTLQYKVFHWSDIDYANINIAFKIAYAVGMLTMGALIDRLGTKKGYALSILIWSLFGMLHAAIKPAFSVIGFAFARFGLGFGEAGNFPSALKSVAEWFPKKDRAFATGIFNAGSNVGAILAPLLIPLVVSANGENWQFAFLLTGSFSFIWIVIWVKVYRQPENHPGVNSEELAYIQSDELYKESNEKLPWKQVFGLRETWAFAIGKLSDAAWWFYLFWSGKFLFDQFGLDIKKLAIPLIIIYVVADIGSIAGGWMSRYFINKGWSLNMARKFTLLLCTLFIIPVVFTTQIKTNFKIDDQFISNLSTTTFKTEIGISEGQETISMLIPLEVIDQLVPLKGSVYASAKEFISSINTAVSSVYLSDMEAAFMNLGRSNNLYWFAVILIALAAGGHQAWSANLLTIPSDLFPRKAVASVVGIGGMVGAIAGLLADFSLGQVLHASGPSGYFFAFLVAGLMYIIALIAIHLLTPSMIPLDDNLKRITE